MADGKSIIILRTRPIGISDLVFALRANKATPSSLETFEKAGLVYDLKPEWEMDFLEFLVKTHPANKKNFEHVLLSPPDHIKPSGIRKELKARSPMIPTLYVVFLSRGKPTGIELIPDYYQLLSLLAEAREDGLIPQET